MLTVANFNLHAGVDGWGRPFDAIAGCSALEADVLVLEEVWTDDGDGSTGGQAEQIAAALGYRAITHALARGRLGRPHPMATAHWRPGFGFRSSRRALYVSSGGRLPRAQTTSARYSEGRPGSWGIAVLTRGPLEVEGSRVLPLAPLARDRVDRAAIVVDATAEGVRFSVVGTHMSHLQNGSHRHFRTLNSLLATEARPDAVLLGDMNLWGPPVRALLPDWRPAVKGRTWPAWAPHSQIDHILVHGSLGVESGQVLPAAGSDHRPVRATLTLR